MENYKTYKQVVSDPYIQFRVSRMEDIWDERKGEPDVPHRHEYYTILLLKKGNGQHFIDFNEYKMEPRQVFFVSPGQIHQVIEYEKSFGYVIVFSHDFLAENNIPCSFIEDLNLFNDHGYTPPLPLHDYELDKLLRYSDEMFDLYQSDSKFKDQAIGSFLQLFLIHCNNLCTIGIDNPQNHEAGNSILRNFKELVNLNFKSWHNANIYASELNVTPDHLNRVVKSLSGKSTKDFIQTRIIVEAKRMLYFSDLTTKEIGYELGFSEPANFSAFFKNATGHSPSGFKLQRQSS
ncbi:MAG: helix-turn-helix domain-containing protein [Bacteroidales bacterium]|nr:helix-turn-helix domain-containing protein [Bacteroidales bacterium]